MKKVRISMLALFAIMAAGMSLTSVSEPGFPFVPNGWVCTFHSEEGWGVSLSDDPLNCMNNPSWAAIAAQHENDRSTHHAPDCIVLVEPDY